MRLYFIFIASVFITSFVAYASDEIELKLSMDGELSEIANLEQSSTDTLLQEAVVEVPVDEVDSMVIKSDETIENIETTSIEELSTLEVITAAEELEVEEIELEENSVAASEIIPKGSNEAGIPIKVDKGVCVDRYPEACVKYVENGECTQNPGWMTVNW